MDESLYNIDQAPVDAYVNGDVSGSAPDGSAPGPLGDNGRDPLSGGLPFDGGPPPDGAGPSDITGMNSDLTDTSTRHALPNPGDTGTNSLDAMVAAAQNQNQDLASGAAFGGQGQGNPDTNSMEGMPAAANAHNADLKSGAAFGGADLSTPPGNGANAGGANAGGAAASSLPNPGVQPSAGAGGAASGSGSGQLSDADWAKDFKAANGYYDAPFDSRAAFLHEAQMGDTAIRGATGGGDQLAQMAQYDSDAKRLLDGIKSTPDFYKSQLAADWAQGHNSSVAQEAQQVLGQGGGQSQAAPGAPASGQGYNRGLGIVDHVNQAVATGNQAQLDWLKSQLVNEVASPMKNTDAMPVAAEIVKDLQTLGVDAKTIHMDNAGTLHFTSASGVPNSFPGDVPLANWVNDLATLKDAIAKQQQPAPPQAGGGYAPRSSAPRSSAPRSSGYSAPRATGGGSGGNGGGTQPPTAGVNAPTLAGEPGVAPDSFGYVDQTGSGGYPSVFDGQPFNNAGRPGYPQEVRPFNVPGGVNY